MSTRNIFNVIKYEVNKFKRYWLIGILYCVMMVLFIGATILITKLRLMIYILDIPELSLIVFVLRLFLYGGLVVGTGLLIGKAYERRNDISGRSTVSYMLRGISGLVLIIACAILIVYPLYILIVVFAYISLMLPILLIIYIPLLLITLSFIGIFIFTFITYFITVDNLDVGEVFRKSFTYVFKKNYLLVLQYAGLVGLVNIFSMYVFELLIFRLNDSLGISILIILPIYSIIINVFMIFVAWSVTLNTIDKIEADKLTASFDIDNKGYITTHKEEYTQASISNEVDYLVDAQSEGTITTKHYDNNASDESGETE